MGFMLAIPIEQADCGSVVNKPFDPVPVVPTLLPLITIGIQLTPARTEASQRPLSFGVALSELIAYSQDCNQTQISLTGGRVVNVEENTAQIDRLVRIAATQNNSNSAKAFLS
jgi:hypothetical protein